MTPLQGSRLYDQTRSNATFGGWDSDRFNQRLYLEAHQQLGANNESGF
ncbi:hypothetical protein VCRLGP8_1520048 [Vibrio crassostreae]|nr:hypothetical protein VCRLGP8_1520048 [Vibrio crassostreae]